MVSSAAAVLWSTATVKMTSLPSLQTPSTHTLLSSLRPEVRESSGLTQSPSSPDISTIDMGQVVPSYLPSCQSVVMSPYYHLIHPSRYSRSLSPHINADYRFYIRQCVLWIENSFWGGYNCETSLFNIKNTRLRSRE